MNNNFYQDLDTNFQAACKLVETELTHEELIKMLRTGNIPERQIAALKINKLENMDDATVLLDNLTGCDGKIREAVSLKIKELIVSNIDYANYFFQDIKKQAKIFADASIDINANICRNVLDCVSILKENAEFSESYLQYIINFIKETFIEIDKFQFRDKKYVINKQLFKLYWCLESIKLFINIINQEILKNILEKSIKEKEYTIREKVAEIIKLSNNNIFEELKIELQKDENYYVRKIFQ